MCMTTMNTTNVTLSKAQLDRLARVEKRVAPLRKRLRFHRVYSAFGSLEDVQRFSEMHVFAIWDFMSLLKALQVELTSVKRLPWIPSGGRKGKLARLVTEMVMRYEFDADASGDTMSHFEMYLEAMRQLGSDTKQITSFLNMLQACATAGVPCPESIDSALLFCSMPKGVPEFLRFTFSLVESKELHKVAASLAFGRQYLIIDKLLATLDKASGEEAETSFAKYRYLLTRHKGLYDRNYTPLSFQILVELCGDDDAKWRDVEEIAAQSLQARLNLYDATYDQMVFRKPIMEYEAMTRSLSGEKGEREGEGEKEKDGLRWQQMMARLSVSIAAKPRQPPDTHRWRRAQVPVPVLVAPAFGKKEEQLLRASVPDVPNVAWKAVKQNPFQCLTY